MQIATQKAKATGGYVTKARTGSAILKSDCSQQAKCDERLQALLLRTHRNLRSPAFLQKPETQHFEP
jgi:hypothetical protein